MKKLFYILIISVLTFFIACEQEDHLFTKDMANVGFYGESASMLEIDNTLSGKDKLVVRIMVTALKNSPSCDVSFDVDKSWYQLINGKYYNIEDGDTTQVNPAMEGVDFKITSSKTVSISDGYGYAPVSLEAINNNEYDPLGNKSLRLKITNNSLGYDLSSEAVMMVTITDDDHPLGWMLGNYIANVTETANGNNQHPIIITAVEGETDKIRIYGMAGTQFGPPLRDPYFILGTVGNNNTTVTISAGQEWEDWNYGPTELLVWEDDNGDGEQVESMIGTIDSDGVVTITFRQQYTFLITSGGNEGLGIQWAWNSDEDPDSPTSVWVRQ